MPSIRNRPILFDLPAPEQYDPIKSMWTYCIIVAIEECTEGSYKDFKWLFEEEDIRRIGSFFWICDALDLCPHKLRNILIKEWQNLDFFRVSMRRLCKQ